MFDNPEAYDRYMGRWSRRLAGPFVEFARIDDGDRVLDVGTGTGELALAVCAARPNCEVVGIDTVDAYIDYACRRRARSRIRFEVADALDLPYSDASFDQSLALLVINFVADAHKAVAEMRRVTREGGTVAACGWDFSGGMAMLRLFWNAAVVIDPTAESRHVRHTPYGKKGQHAELWVESGLIRVEESELVVSLEFASFDDFWSPFLSGSTPTSAYASSLPPERQRALCDRLREQLSGGAPDRAFALQARAWTVRGTVPRGGARVQAIDRGARR